MTPCHWSMKNMVKIHEVHFELLIPRIRQTWPPLTSTCIPKKMLKLGSNEEGDFAAKEFCCKKNIEMFEKHWNGSIILN